ncbi:MAG: 23S rRNA (adenine(2503)-C(2))-methyltransferase RlmN [Gammaproteobacteria bacterium]|nr:23S rRNA (adenine(2503)-C(2))-methyltransferase RlmN [Gammaproteobacteria bacterium]
MKTLSTDRKTNWYSLTREGWQQFLSEIDNRSFRAQQVMKWIYHERVASIELMSNLSKNFRSALASSTENTLPKLIHTNTSRDGTVKWIVETESGGAVECVLIPDGRRNTLCISSQLGCSLDCIFCATGKQGFAGNLSVADIVGQVVIVTDWLRLNSNYGELTNIVFMGMGEPLMNFAATMDACDIFMDDLAFGISKRRVTISTAGVVPRILDMCRRTEASLAVSLHAANDEVRNYLVPLNKKYPIAMLMDACREYLSSLHDRRIVTFEYTLIEDVNDGDQAAKELVQLLRDFRCKVNLIPFNPFPLSTFRRPTENKILRFYKQLRDEGIMVTNRTTRGEDIDAACGQLIGDFQDKTRRRARYRSAQSEASIV